MSSSNNNENKQALVLVEDDATHKGLVRVTLNRPHAMNAMNLDLLFQLAQTFRQLNQDPSVRVVVLSGAGKAFCAGIDLTAAAHVFQNPNGLASTDDVVYQMEQANYVIIGAIHGFAITGGFELALACDILLASSKTQFIDTHAKFGIAPSWGLSQKLSRIIGIYRAKQVSLAAQPIPATQAKDWGLVTQVFDTQEALLFGAHDLAKQILLNHSKLVQLYKKVIDDGYAMEYGEARVMEKYRAQEYYKAMKPEEFAQMKKFIEGRRSKM